MLGFASVGGIFESGGMDAGVVSVVWYPVCCAEVREEERGEKGKGEAGVDESGELAEVVMDKLVGFTSVMGGR